jgi:hypothetical protein
MQMRDLNMSGAVRSIKNIYQLDQQIEAEAISFIQKYVTNHCFHKITFLELLPMIAQRVLKLLLIDVSKDFRPLSYKLLENLYTKISLPNFTGMTTHGCYLRSSSGGYIAVKKEARRVRKQPAHIS